MKNLILATLALSTLNLTIAPLARAVVPDIVSSDGGGIKIELLTKDGRVTQRGDQAHGVKFIYQASPDDAFETHNTILGGRAFSYCELATLKKLKIEGGSSTAKTWAGIGIGGGATIAVAGAAMMVPGVNVLVAGVLIMAGGGAVLMHEFSEDMSASATEEKIQEVTDSQLISDMYIKSDEPAQDLRKKIEATLKLIPPAPTGVDPLQACNLLAPKQIVKVKIVSPAKLSLRNRPIVIPNSFHH